MKIQIKILKDVICLFNDNYYSVPGSVLDNEVVINAVRVMMFPQKWLEEVEKKAEDRTF